MVGEAGFCLLYFQQKTAMIWAYLIILQILSNYYVPATVLRPWEFEDEPDRHRQVVTGFTLI